MCWFGRSGATRTIAILGNDDGNAYGTMYKCWNKVAARSGGGDVQVVNEV